MDNDDDGRDDDDPTPPNLAIFLINWSTILEIIGTICELVCQLVMSEVRRRQVRRWLLVI